MQITKIFSKNWDRAAGKFVTTQKLLIDGEDVNAKDKDGNTPLHRVAEAAAFHNALALLEDVKLLIDNGAEVNAKDKDGETPLILAARQNTRSAAEVEKLLIDNGAEVNAKDKDGWTPLHFAASFGATGLVKLLIDNGAEVNAENNDGDTPLEAMQDTDWPPTVAGVWWKDAAEIRKLLIDNGAKKGI